MGNSKNSYHEKLNVALMYLDKLSQGIHPNSGVSLFDAQDKANIGIVNCLSFVKEVINKQFDDTPEVLVDFSVTEKTKSFIPISQEPLSISRFTEIINENAREPGMNRLRGRQITGWLYKNNYLKYEDINGKPYRVPTPKANAIGINSYVYTRQDVEYSINTYDSNAQRFIIEHLEDIIEDRLIEE
ncbi:MAG: hypothetical protein E7218_02435 [Anaerofustis stercorihominis]|nr:hypothetical protein [Anaerofustis stercorihominis]